MLIQYNTAVFAEDLDKIVRVGCYNIEGSLHKDVNGDMSGYYYDYLNALSTYTGVKYEFVEATWSECLDMLEDGRIDLLTDLIHTEQREQDIHYSFLETGYDNINIYGIKGIEPESRNNGEGSKWGILKGGIGKESIYRYIEENKLQVDLIEFNTVEDMERALRDGAVEYVGVTAFSRSLFSNYQLYDQIPSQFTYIGVAKGREDLLEQIEYGISCINRYQPDLKNQLHLKYAGNILNKLLNLTYEELKYLQEIDKITFLAYKLEVDSLYNGERIYEVLAEQIATELGKAFEYRELETTSATSEELLDEAGTVLFSRGLIAGLFGKENILSAPVVEFHNFLATKEASPYINPSEYRIAVPKGIVSDSLSRWGEELGIQLNQIIYYDSTKECLDAVIEGDCNATVIGEFAKSKYINKYYEDRLKFEVIPHEDAIYNITSQDNYLMASIISKMMSRNDKYEVLQRAKSDSEGKFYGDIEEFLYQYPGLTGVMLTAIITLSAYIVYSNRLKKKNQEILKLLKKVNDEEIRVRNELADSLFQLELYKSSNFSGTFTGDPVNFKILYCNELFAAILGYTVDECRGLSGSEIVLEESRQEIFDRIRKAICMKDVREKFLNISLRTKDGSIRHVTVSGKFEVDEDAVPIFKGAITDITEITETYNELIEMEEKYERVLAGSDINVCEYDIERREFILLPAQSMEGLFGTVGNRANPQYMVEKNLVHPQDIERYLAMYSDLENGAVKAGGDFRIKQLETEAYRYIRIKYTSTVDVSHKPCKAFGIYYDITEDMGKEYGEYKLPEIFIHTFGNFEMFIDGSPLIFNSAKAKELLAYLVDRKGTSCTTAELAAVLYEDKPYNASTKSLVQKTIKKLIQELEKKGVEKIIIKKWNALSIDSTLISCDYYDFLNDKTLAVRSFTGEYMANYSWAEYTAGMLSDK